MTAAFVPDAGRARALLAGVGAADGADPDILDRHARVVWSHLAEPGDAVAGTLVAEQGPRAALADLVTGMPSTAFPSVHPLDLRAGSERWRRRLDHGAVAHALTSAARLGVRLVVPGDADWPVSLDDLGPHAPLCLWVRGDAAALGRSGAVAVVGARAATSYGEHVALELAGDLAAAGHVVVSGAAYGIDGAAHRAALGVGGTTVAFLAGGVDRPYPAGHAGLVERIIGQGAVVSELPCGQAPTKWRFLARNRLIAAVSAGTVVVEAGWRSGSLNTAGHAATLGRALGAVPGPVTSAASAGCHRLLREYGASCVTSADEVREMLGEMSPVGRSTPAADADTVRVRDALSVRSPRTAEDVAARAGLTLRTVEAVLGVLALEGRARRESSGWTLARRIHRE